MRIESGPTLERRIRTLLMTLMVAAFGGWFAYDGWIGYPKENLKEHLSVLPVDERPKVDLKLINPSVTPESLPAAKTVIRGADNSKKQYDALTKLYGREPTCKNNDAWYYFGPTHRLVIPLRAGAPIGAEIYPAARKPTDLAGQKLLSGVLGVFSLYLFWCLFRIHRTHAVLDESGLSYSRRSPIAWERMTGLDSSKFNAKGFVDLVYQVNGVERRLRLDEYHLAAFDEIIDAICSRKEFQNPLPVNDPPGPTGSPS